MNRTLYRYEMKNSIKLLVIFAAIMAMYVACIVWMFDPEMMESLATMYDSMPQVMAAVGMTQTSASMIGFMSSYLYGFIMIVFPMIYMILRSKNLLAGKVEKKTMASLLASPVSRRKVILTQICVILTGLILLLLFTTFTEWAFSELWFPGELDYKGLWSMNAGLLSLHFFIGGLCMLASAAFNDAGASAGVSGGICAVMFLIQMIRNTGISDSLDNLKYGTFFTLYDPSGLIDGTAQSVTGVIILAVVGLIMYIASVLVFEKRDLPL